MNLDYWDTSGLIRAFTRAEKPRGITRPHSVAEFFCVLTGPGLAVSVNGRIVKKTLSPAVAFKAVEETFSEMRFYELGGRETISCVGDSVPSNILGKNIHDWMHCQAAQASKADRIKTLNTSDFSAMTKLPLSEP